MTATLNKKKQVNHQVDFSVSPPLPLAAPTTKKIISWQVTIQFSSKDDAEDFIEDMTIFNNPETQASFKKAAKESEEGKARPIEELFKEYGI